MLGWCIYGMSLVEIGSFFAFQMEGQNFQKIIFKKNGGEVWLQMSLKDALFIRLSEYITFMTHPGVEQFENCEKWRKKKTN